MTSNSSLDLVPPQRPILQTDLTSFVPSAVESKPSTQSFLNVEEKSVIIFSKNPNRGLRFWMCIGAIMTSSFLIAVDLVRIPFFFRSLRDTKKGTIQASLATASPVIVADLHGSEFEWIGASYALAATAFLPMSGGLAQVINL